MKEKKVKFKRNDQRLNHTPLFKCKNQLFEKRNFISRLISVVISRLFRESNRLMLVQNFCLDVILFTGYSIISLKRISWRELIFLC